MWAKRGCCATPALYSAPFSSPSSSPSPGVLPECCLAEICSHEGQTDASAASGTGMSLRSGKRHTGLHRGNKAVSSFSALSLFVPAHKLILKYRLIFAYENVCYCPKTQYFCDYFCALVTVGNVLTTYLPTDRENRPQPAFITSWGLSVNQYSNR